MIDAHLAELRAINPAYIRFFIQEYYNLLPALNTYHWGTLDSTLDAIAATGAKPIPNICFKPRVLYPTINQDITAPNNWAAWDTLVFRLVRHCLDKNYGIRYWEIGNEVDIGEDGGTPFRCTPSGYVQWYTHTANAVRRADPSAKVGGPALCCPFNGSIGSALIAHCGAGNAPMDFYSWHAYGGGWGNTNGVKSMLSAYPSLSNVQTLISEWNVSLDPQPGNYQCGFCLETMRQYWSEGTSIAAYYHIRDWRVDPNDFVNILSNPSYMANFWNGATPRGGLWDFDGRKMPIYYVFLWLSKMTGTQVRSTGANSDIRSFAVKNGTSIYAIVWNFGSGTSYNVTMSVSGVTAGTCTLKKLNYSTIHDDVVRSGAVAGLSTNPPVVTLGRYDIAWLEITPDSNAAATPLKGIPGISFCGRNVALYDVRGCRVSRAGLGQDNAATRVNGVLFAVPQSGHTGRGVKTIVVSR
jgi:hypothetical protein